MPSPSEFAPIGIEALEPRRLLAFVGWDGGGGDSLWHNPLNWSGDALPTASDHVVIDGPGSAAVVLDQPVLTQIASLWSLDPIEVRSGTLSIAGEWRQSADLTISGGTVASPANLLLNGDLMWTGGAITGGIGHGKVQILPGRTATIAGDVLLADRDLINNGTVVWASGNIRVDGATILNLAGRTFLAQSDGALTPAGPGAAASRFINRGTLVRDGDAGETSTIGITFSTATNQSFIIYPGGLFPWQGPIIPPAGSSPGIVDVRAGTLEFTGDVAQKQGDGFLNGDRLIGGDWRVSGTGRLLLPGQDLTTVQGSVTLEGAGASFPQLEDVVYINQLTLKGGRGFTFDALASVGALTLSGPATIGAVTVSTLTIEDGAGHVEFTEGLSAYHVTIGQGATLTLGGVSLFQIATNISGAGTLRLTGEMSWHSGTISGAGQLLITPTGRLNLTDGGLFSFSVKTLTRRLVNHGIIDWNGLYGDFSLSGELVNRGTINMQAWGYLSTSSGVGPGNTPAFIRNFGTIHTSSNLPFRGAGGGVKLLNAATGTVHVHAGVLVLNGGGTSGGTWRVDQGAELIFGGLANSLLNATLDGGGRIRVASESTWGATTVSGAGDMLITPLGHLKVVPGANILNPIVFLGRSAIGNYGTIEIGTNAVAQLNSGLTNAGRIILGAGSLNVGGNLTLLPASVLRFRQAGLELGQPLTVGGTIAMGGSLIAQLSPGVPVGSLYWAFGASARTGGFAAVLAEGLPAGRSVQLDFVGVLGQINVVGA